jgi:hypothetical protein
LNVVLAMACSQPQPGCRFDEISVPLVCGELYLLLQRCNCCVDARQQRSAFRSRPLMGRAINGFCRVPKVK